MPNAHEGAIHAPKERLDVEHDYADRFLSHLNVEGLEILYREAGPRDASTIVFFIKNEGAPILTPIH